MLYSVERYSIALNNLQLQELNPVIAGRHRCKSGHRYGPHIRNYTLLHYVLSGKGTLYIDENKYPVYAGQVFMILPGQITTYEADIDDPWNYCWVGFDGSLSGNFASLSPVFSLDKDIFTDIFPPENEQNPELWITGGLYRLCAYLFHSHAKENAHVQKVKNFIRTGYMDELTVERIADSMNLDRRYLSRLFKEHTGVTIQQQLINTRMEAADKYLRQGYSVQEAAALSGYRDVPNFSRMYKLHYGTAPKNRKNK